MVESFLCEYNERQLQKDLEKTKVQTTDSSDVSNGMTISLSLQGIETDDITSYVTASQIEYTK
jgi:hypothetical protein